METPAITSTPKQPPPQLSDEKKRSAKKVRVFFAHDSPVSMDTEDTQDPSLVSQVPATQGSSDPPPSPPPQASFKDKLLDGGASFEEEEEDFPLSQDDVVFYFNGPIPAINFAVHVLDSLHRWMGYAVVIKLLGKTLGYRLLRSQLQHIWRPTGSFKLIDLEDNCFLVKFKELQDYELSLTKGPWVIFGHYLAVQPWSPDFDPQHFSIQRIMGWICLPRLPTHYYHKSVIRQIGSMFGDVIRVDYHTESGDRGKFARLAVNLDLTRPLVSKVQVDGQTIYAEYEGLPTICFQCGRYGHLKDGCPELQTHKPDSPASVVAHEPSIIPQPTPDAREATPFGEWMQAPRRKRPPMKGDRKVEPKDSKPLSTGSRYDVLRQPLATESHELHPEAQARPLLRGEPSKVWRKVDEARDSRTSGEAAHSKVAPPKTPSKPSATVTPHHMATSLDPLHNAVVRIEDSRLPSTSERKPPDPSPHRHGKGVKIPHGSKKKSSDQPRPSDHAIQSIAKSLHQTLADEDITMLVEGVDFSSSPSL